MRTVLDGQVFVEKGGGSQSLLASIDIALMMEQIRINPGTYRIQIVKISGKDVTDNNPETN